MIGRGSIVRVTTVTGLDRLDRELCAALGNEQLLFGIRCVLVVPWLVPGQSRWVPVTAVEMVAPPTEVAS